MRVVPIEEAETAGHLRAVPPPPCHYGPPRQARSVRIGEDSPEARRLAEVIALRLGTDAVKRQPAGTFTLEQADADVIFFPTPGSLPFTRDERVRVQKRRSRVACKGRPAVGGGSYRA